MKNKPDCYKCIYVGEIPGDTHICCNHPEVKANPDPYNQLVALMGRGMPTLSKAAAKLNIDAHPHGIRMGWFYWPYNFDPLWLERCDGFQPKESEVKP